MPIILPEEPTPIAKVPSTENKTGGWRTFRPIIDYEKCIRCYICWKFCPDTAIDFAAPEKHPAPKDALKRFDTVEINYDYCKGCGICANECPANAIELVLEQNVGGEEE
ncbi:MAG: 4Fe-4S dicluster domain-containing protein [Euryarchaeota archaeon]|nr:4Fe-4S dicluster domain-containing protein [Euryarchaeota archaeon]